MEPEAVVAITFDDGSVGRMQLFHREPVNDVEQSWTDEDIAAEIRKSAFERRPVSWRRCDMSDFPVEHHDFRAAWTDDGKVIGVDMAKARAVTRDRLRAERVPLIKAEDVKVSRALALEDKAAVVAAEAERQRLRDITALPAIDAAKTPDELKAISVSDSASPAQKTVRG
jgi:hypothetical protein